MREGGLRRRAPRAPRKQRDSLESAKVRHRGTPRARQYRTLVSSSSCYHFLHVCGMRMRKHGFCDIWPLLLHGTASDEMVGHCSWSQSQPGPTFRVGLPSSAGDSQSRQAILLLYPRSSLKPELRFTWLAPLSLPGAHRASRVNRHRRRRRRGASAYRQQRPPVIGQQLVQCPSVQAVGSGGGPSKMGFQRFP